MPVDPAEAYDDNNIFAKILRGELPSTKVFEDEHVLAFQEIAPQAPVHVLVIPKGKYVSWDDFSAKASAEEITAFVRATAEIARQLDLVETGYRLLSNIGPDSGQEIAHLHVHLCGGKPLGRMISG